ncbi:MAG: methyltransferase domain-containing protein [Kaiparowitsia implicata GSE-PSE-MK54-09C]|jgi:tocopherol O-methyltransferase|nr:methyltransferase domain-containing protein [Kaiparowitsia implicata GSE-PSE-MK54-09C]
MTVSLQEKIRQFYDQSSTLWEDIWGEHMHHGYYGADGSQKKERRQAQIDLIDELLAWGGVEQAHEILDVGCGIGGSSLYLAERFGARATGITLSPVQANRATERAEVAGVSAQFLVADALQMPFDDASFDLVWTLESGEHMPDKRQFLSECHRVLKPGGLLLMATWCHRPTTPDTPLSADEQALLDKIYRVYCLPFVVSLPDYEAIAQSLNFQQLRTADWSTAVAPFWDVVIGSALTPQAVVGLLRAGKTTIQAALSLGLMQRGYRSGLVRFGLLCGQKSS